VTQKVLKTTNHAENWKLGQFKIQVYYFVTLHYEC